MLLPSRNISRLTFRLSSQQVENSLEIFTSVSLNFGTELRKWWSARRKTPLIFFRLAESSGISSLWTLIRTPGFGQGKIIVFFQEFRSLVLFCLLCVLLSVVVYLDFWQFGSLDTTVLPPVFCSNLGSDASTIPSFASSQSTWGALRRSLKSLSVEFAVLSDKAAQQVKPQFSHSTCSATLVQNWFWEEEKKPNLFL